MTQEKRNSDKHLGSGNHETDSLFTEWPTPSEVVKGFEGNPASADRKQWNGKGSPKKS